MKKHRVALVHEWLTKWGGSENVLEAIHSIFPGPIFTLVQDEQMVKGSWLEKCTIYPSFIQRLPWGKSKYRTYLPFFPIAIEQFDLSKFDLVISSSHAVAKGALTTASQLHICYCHSPVRYAWDLYHQYLEEANLKSGIKSVFVRMVLHYLRLWDVSSANRVDFFVANSEFIARRVKKIYQQEATVIYPPVEVDRFEVPNQKEDFYVTISRMVPYKKVSLIVEAFNQMPDKRLVVIGDGPDFKRIKGMASPNVSLLGFQPFEVLKDNLQRAKAFVYAAEEDFGITLVEAQACGTPVIALGRGGALETVIPGQTGLFFWEQTSADLIKTVLDFEERAGSFDAILIRKNAERFSRDRFCRQFKGFVEEKLQEMDVKQPVL
jgi:glycosyltransferase involved in cell wall biosynthesis